MPVAINCDPAALAKAAACYCSTEQQQLADIVYLLKQIAGNTMTPAQLAQASACFCSDKKTQYANITYLLCQISSGGSGPSVPCNNVEGAGDPT